MKNIEKYKWLIIASCCSTFTVLIVKHYELYSYNWLLVTAVISECGLIYSYIQLLKRDDLISQFGLVKIMSILLVILPSIILFESKLTIKKIIGLLFGIIAIYLLN